MEQLKYKNFKLCCDAPTMQQNDPAQPQNNEEDVQMMNADESDQPEQENPILPASVEPAEKLIKRFDNFGFRIQKIQTIVQISYFFFRFVKPRVTN